MPDEHQSSEHYLDRPCEDCGGRDRVRSAQLARLTPYGVPDEAVVRLLCRGCWQQRRDLFIGRGDSPQPSPLAPDPDEREEP